LFQWESYQPRSLFHRAECLDLPRDCHDAERRFGERVARELKSMSKIASLVGVLLLLVVSTGGAIGGVVKGVVTLSCGKCDVSVPQELSGRDDHSPPRVHRRGGALVVATQRTIQRRVCRSLKTSAWESVSGLIFWPRNTRNNFAVSSSSSVAY
jgi:hypothetical protein